MWYSKARFRGPRRRREMVHNILNIKLTGIARCTNSVIILVLPQTPASKVRRGMSGRILMKNVLVAAVAVFTFATPAAAATLVVNGTTADKPTYNRAFTLTTLSTVGTAVNYESTIFTVDTTGAYTLADDASYDTFLSLYSVSFDAGSPLNNLRAVDDDGGTGSNSLISFALTAGVNYFAVASAYDNNISGAYTLTIAGPGAITLAGVPAVPEPATWAMMLVGFGMIGATTRYRRRNTTTVYA